ncbi:MAG: MBOAT family protein [Bacteroidales bacterium]|nr:MBOAT family protein [Bacteroidales bacterium]MCF8388949.1 MBOAT family protein [Bacteroidales bacterium]MCF8396888.1 MBOAT family protein [Bacteroidales bacterium]
MLFNSLDFAIFLPIVFIVYWFITNRNLKLQNILIVVASYLFYGWWDWRFLALIFISTVVDYTVGRGLSNQEDQSKRKLLLWTSILVNIGILGFFKYYNFFQENFIAAFSFFGMDIKPNSLNIILPVGISFYTFQTMSYTIDVYRGKLKPTKDFISFSAFVSFFPQLVAGPIERATNLLPQFYKKRVFTYARARDGMLQILWGLFKKLVIADNCAEYANMIFNNSDQYSGVTLILGAVFFAFQIYGDFSGYSDIAIGTARLLGFDLMKNFAAPYFSRDIAEFWRRWHISLSSWFRDYLYIPIGGSRGSFAKKVRNTFVIFIVSGFWHGANWTFIVWGALNAIYFLPYLLAKKNRKNLDTVAQDRWLPSAKEFLSMIITFSLTVFAWIFFRAENIEHAVSYISGIYSSTFFSIPEIFSWESLKKLYILMIIFIVIEWLGRNKNYGFQFVESKPKYIVYPAVYLLVMSIVLFMSLEVQEFIYFQF